MNNITTQIIEVLLEGYKVKGTSSQICCGERMLKIKYHSRFPILNSLFSNELYCICCGRQETHLGRFEAFLVRNGLD